VWIVRLINGRQITAEGKIGEFGDVYVEGSYGTLFGLAQTNYNNFSTASKITPDDCTTIDVTSSAVANTFGDFVRIIDVNSGTSSFSMHWLNIADITENGVYVLDICTVNPANIQELIECLAKVNVSRISAFTRSFQLAVHMRNVADGCTIAVRVKKSGADVGIVKFVCAYHSVV
jgi:hypothetical protein